MERQNVGIIIFDGMGGDFGYKVCPIEIFNKIAEYSPTDERGNLDVDKFVRFAGDIFYDKEKDCNNENVLKEWFCQEIVTEHVDLSEYNVMGFIMIPGW